MTGNICFKLFKKDMDMALKDSDSGLVHQSEKKLSFQEVLVIAEAAKSSHYFDRHVQWWVSSTPFGFPFRLSILE